MNVPYLRPCVGIMLTRPDKRIWVGERIDYPGSYQMPQGGIDTGEDATTAALRELYEETGIDHTKVQLVGKSKECFDIIWPLSIRQSAQQKMGPQFMGQRQQWFLFSLHTMDDPTNLTMDDPEFKHHQWINAESVVKLAVDFRKEVYKNVLAEFTGYFCD